MPKDSKLAWRDVAGFGTGAGNGEPKGMPFSANSEALPRGNFAAIHGHRCVIRKNYCVKEALQIG